MLIDTIFKRAFAKNVTTERDKRQLNLAQGGAKTFEDYREQVGYLRALGDVLIWMEELDKEIHDKE